MSDGKKIVRVRDVMKNNFDLIDGRMTVMEALKEMNHIESKSLIVDKRHEDDEYGILLLSDIAKNVLAKDRSPNRVNVYEIMAKPVLTVDPDMDIRYCARFLERFGLNCYGCCEPLDRRWRVIEQIPRLRRISISPWSNLGAMAEKLGDRYIYSMKPHPNMVATSSCDEDDIRATLRQDFQITRDCRVEAILKDTHTIQHDPQRVIKWVQIAREEAESL